TADGVNALFHNTTGAANTATGVQALFANVAGNFNNAVGSVSLSSNTAGSGNNAFGNTAFFSNTTGGQNTAIGDIAVSINSSGKLGTLTSSARFKDDIKPMDKASEVLFALRPVTLRYKKEIDSAGTLQLGLVAEDVEKLSPSLVVRDKEGKPT